MTRQCLPVVDRFEAKIERCPMSGCWLWSDAPDDCGYGRLGLPGNQMVKAHRLSYELHRGPIPDGLQVLHSCDTPPCVNPDHLFLGTHDDNMADRERKGRGNYVPPPARPGSLHPRARLSENIVLRLRQQVANGEHVNLSVEAPLLGVAISSLSRALSGRTWTHVGVGQADGWAEEPAELGPENLDLFDTTKTTTTGSPTRA